MSGARAPTWFRVKLRHAVHGDFEGRNPTDGDWQAAAEATRRVALAIYAGSKPADWKVVTAQEEDAT